MYNVLEKAKFWTTIVTTTLEIKFLIARYS